MHKINFFFYLLISYRKNDKFTVVINQPILLISSALCVIE